MVWQWKLAIRRQSSQSGCEIIISSNCDKKSFLSRMENSMTLTCGWLWKWRLGFFHQLWKKWRKHCNVSSILIGSLRERYFDFQFLWSTQRITFTSFFSLAGFTMSRGDWSRMPGHFRPWLFFIAVDTSIQPLLCASFLFFFAGHLFCRASFLFAVCPSWAAALYGLHLQQRKQYFYPMLNRSLIENLPTQRRSSLHFLTVCYLSSYAYYLVY